MSPEKTIHILYAIFIPESVIAQEFKNFVLWYLVEPLFSLLCLAYISIRKGTLGM
jgi:hypothetical protein